MIESDGLFVEEKEVTKKAFRDYAGQNVDYIDAYLAAYALIKGADQTVPLCRWEIKSTDCILCVEFIDNCPEKALS